MVTLALPTENALAPVAVPTVAQPKAPLVGNAALPLSAVYERFCRHKSSTGAWKDPEVSRAHDYDPIIPPFIALVGDKPLGLLSSEDIGKYAEHVLQGEGRKIGTKKRDLDRVKAMLNYARKHLGGPDVSGPLSLEMSYNALHDSYEPFTGPELVSLFESETYNSNSFRKASQFWLPLIGLYTGARIDEPASMLVKDIVEENGIWAFYMSGDEANVWDLQTHTVNSQAAGSMSDDKTDTAYRLSLFRNDGVIEYEVYLATLGEFKLRSANDGIIGGGNP